MTERFGDSAAKSVDLDHAKIEHALNLLDSTTTPGQSQSPQQERSGLFSSQQITCSTRSEWLPDVTVQHFPGDSDNSAHPHGTSTCVDIHHYPDDRDQSRYPVATITCVDIHHYPDDRDQSRYPVATITCVDIHHYPDDRDQSRYPVATITCVDIHHYPDDRDQSRYPSGMITCVDIHHTTLPDTSISTCSASTDYPTNIHITCSARTDDPTDIHTISCSASTDDPGIAHMIYCASIIHFPSLNPDAPSVSHKCSSRVEEPPVSGLHLPDVPITINGNKVTPEQPKELSEEEKIKLQDEAAKLAKIIEENHGFSYEDNGVRNQVDQIFSNATARGENALNYLTEQINEKLGKDHYDGVRLNAVVTGDDEWVHDGLAQEVRAAKISVVDTKSGRTIDHLNEKRWEIRLAG